MPLPPMIEMRKQIPSEWDPLSTWAHIMIFLKKIIKSSPKVCSFLRFKYCCIDVITVFWSVSPEVTQDREVTSFALISSVGTSMASLVARQQAPCAGPDSHSDTVWSRSSGQVTCHLPSSVYSSLQGRNWIMTLSPKRSADHQWPLLLLQRIQTGWRNVVRSRLLPCRVFRAHQHFRGCILESRRLFRLI